MTIGIEERSELEAEPLPAVSAPRAGHPDSNVGGYVGGGAVLGGGAVAAVAGALGGVKAAGFGALVGGIAGALVGNMVADTRRQWAVTQATLARLVGVSERSVAGWEARGLPARQSAERRFIEMRRLHRALSRVLPERDIPGWLDRPNEALHESTPLQVIERGQIDRIYTLIFYAESGTPG